jgi:hypothetical protein
MSPVFVQLAGRVPLLGLRPAPGRIADVELRRLFSSIDRRSVWKALRGSILVLVFAIGLAWLLTNRGSTAATALVSLAVSAALGLLAILFLPERLSPAVRRFVAVFVGGVALIGALLAIPAVEKDRASGTLFVIKPGIGVGGAPVFAVPVPDAGPPVDYLRGGSQLWVDCVRQIENKYGLGHISDSLVSRVANDFTVGFWDTGVCRFAWCRW